MSATNSQKQEAIMVTLEQLKTNSVPFEILEEAFGPSSLGILLVKDLPSNFAKLRRTLLSYATYLANLPEEELGQQTRSFKILSSAT